MSSYNAIRAAVCTLVETISGLVRSPMPLTPESLMDGLAPGPVGGWFVVRPAVLGYGGDQGSSVDGDAAFEILFTWAHAPDPDTRIGEAMDRAEAIRNKLLDDAALSVDCRLDPQDASFIYSEDLILCTIPFAVLSYRST